MPHTSMQVTYKEYNMKYILTAIAAIMIAGPSLAEVKPLDPPKVNWFVSTQVSKSVGTSSYFEGSLFDKKLKPYGDDKEVYNPHIKDWFVDVKITDAQGNVTGFQRMYSHSIVRFMDANGEIYNITFKRTPVVK